MRGYLFFGILCCFLFVCIFNIECAARELSPLPPPTILLTIERLKLNVELASTPESRARGLMFRKVLPAERGILFVFPREEKLTFWMKNTGIPLSIIFINRNKEIVSVKSLTPYSEQPVDSSKPAIYAIELNRDECERYNIKPGMHVEGLGRVSLPLH